MQDRSRETVRRILDAATEVLEQYGYYGASTVRIAAAAGISPGSLYQYFPNKDSIFEALVAEYTEQLIGRVSRKLYELLPFGPRVLVPAAVEAQVDALLERPEILRVICGQLPGHSMADVIKPLEALFGGAIRTFAGARRDRPLDFDVDAGTWSLVRLLGTTISYVVDEPPIAKDVFVNDMTRLVLGHPMTKWASSQLSDGGSGASQHQGLGRRHQLDGQGQRRPIQLHNEGPSYDDQSRTRSGFGPSGTQDERNLVRPALSSVPAR